MIAPYTDEARTLLFEGAQSLAKMEADGMRVDTAYLEATHKRIKKKVTRLEADLEGYEVMRVWRRTYGHNTKLDSPTQLSRVMFEEMGYKPAGYTKGSTAGKRQYRTDEDSLQLVDDPFVEKYLKVKKLKNLDSTYVRAILREAVDGVLHPHFGLGRAATYRSNCEDTNVQNIPRHDPYIGPIIRRAFVPRPGNVLVEVDFSQAEVRVAACYTKDRNLIRYVNDPKSDMHRDMACKLFLLPPGEVKAAKPVRQLAKGGYVFASFYGDYYIGTARGMWQNAHILGTKLADGTPLLEHLRRKGITELGALDPKQPPRPGSFEAHVKECDRYLWKTQFPEYSQWKTDNYRRYCERGYLESYTGFVYRGYMSRKDVNNYPIQGSAFHCLLWALNRIILKKLAKARWGAKVVCEIHDSLLADVPVSELADFCALCRHTMTRLLEQHYPWLVVPMEVEIEVCESSWAEKKPYLLN